jgi:hypothetical protein
MAEPMTRMSNMPLFRMMTERTRWLLTGCLVAAVPLTVLLVAVQPAEGHGIFKKTLEKKYGNLRITCNMCHVPKEAKTTRNEFGKLFYEELKGQDLSARWNAVKGAERRTFEDEVMAPAILEALTRVAEKKTEDGRVYGDLIAAGQVEGSKLKSDSDPAVPAEDEEDGGQ